MAELERARDGAFDDLLDAIEDGEGYYLECADGHGWLPPRRICPECGSQDLEQQPLPDAGEVISFTEISVAAPSWTEDAPYITAVADFGPVGITGLLRGADDPTVGMVVGLDVGERLTTGDRTIVFRPR
ncbi:MAG: Zn-ribbon domain-containing OB-fold protein [Salinirussus sp.]